MCGGVINGILFITPLNNKFNRSIVALRVVKTREFKKWSKSEKISDQNLVMAISEIEKGLIDANLGGGLIKKRIAIGSSGKSGGVRTIIAYKKGQRAFFCMALKRMS